MKGQRHPHLLSGQAPLLFKHKQTSAVRSSQGEKARGSAKAGTLLDAGHINVHTTYTTRRHFYDLILSYAL